MRRLVCALILGFTACGTPPPDAPRERIVIPPGASIRLIADTLSAHGVISSERWFRILARLGGYDRRLQSGPYELIRGEGARAALKALPRPFSESLGNVVLLVEDFADDETLKSMGIEDPFELSGLYEGVPLTERSVDQSGRLPDTVRLFRRPILDEWADGNDTLEHLVSHVLIHEIGHHFGLSDNDMHALEDSVA